MREKHNKEATYLNALCFGDGDLCAVPVASIKGLTTVFVLFICHHKKCTD
jgi:uncharacterized membrane protein